MLVCILALSPVRTAAQQTRAEASETTSTAAIAEVERQIRLINESSDLEAAVRDELLALYNEALTLLRTAQDWQEKAAAFDRSREQTPERLEEVRAHLQQSPDPLPSQLARDMSLSELEEQLAAAETNLATARSSLTQLEDERAQRNRARIELPQAIAALRTRLDQARDELVNVFADPGDPVAEARTALLDARIEALQREIDAREKELQSYETRSRLLTARLDLAAQQVARAERELNFWQQWVNQGRKSEAAQIVRETERTLEGLQDAPPALREIARTNLELAQRRSGVDGISRAVEEAEADVALLDSRLDELQRDFSAIQERVETIGLNKALGMLLRTRRSELPNIRQSQKDVADRQNQIGDVQYQILVLDDLRRELADVEARVNQILMAINGALTTDDRAEVETTLRLLLQQQKELLDALLNDYRRYFDLLVEMDARETQLIEAVQNYRNYINEHVLWMASTSAIQLRDIPNTLESLIWLFDGAAWLETVEGLVRDVLADFFIYLAAAVVIFLLLRHHREMKHDLRELGLQAAKRTNRVFRPTLDALLYSLVLAAVWPLLAAFLGWRLAYEAVIPLQGKAIGAGLLAGSIYFFFLNFVRTVFRPHGLADSHFKWPAAGAGNFRRQIIGLIYGGLPILVLVYALQWQPEERYQDSLGRLALIGGMVMLALMLARMFRPNGILVGRMLSSHRGSFWDKMRIIWISALVGLPVVLAVMAALGYYYTAVQLAWRVGATVALAFIALVIAGVIQRYIELTRIQIAREQARKRARESSESRAIPEDGATDAPQIQEERLDVSDINVQAERMLRLGTVVVLLAGVWFIWADVMPALTALERVELWSTTTEVAETTVGPDGEATAVTRVVEEPVTLGGVILAILVIGLMVILSRNVAGILEFSILQKFDLKSGERYAIITIVRYVIMIIAIVMAFSVIGISWGSIQWLVAAMGVGLGFGLQEVFANFVSGMIILFERPVRVGDIVTVGDTSGTVSKIRIRATTIVDYDRRELVVPNKDFITQRVINWTLTDPVTRVTIPVGVAYGSDTTRAQEIMMEIAKNHPLIVDDPAPWTIFSGFGADSLELSLRVFLPTRDVWITVVNDMHTRIHEAFMKEGIVIAFPQRDVHIDSLGPLKVDPIEVRLVEENGYAPRRGQTSRKSPEKQPKSEAAGSASAPDGQTT